MARILVADDDADIRDLIEMKLVREGHELSLVADGALALAAVRRDPPDLLLVDMMMPELNGLDVVRAVRADPAVAALKVIMLTARAHDGDTDAALGAGVDDYMSKPFSPRELAARVATLLASSR